MRAVNLIIFALALIGTPLTTLALGYHTAPVLVPLWLVAIALLVWAERGRAG